jgi:mannitol/fructose-specific phosphotransferase system IIA component (Ntr-type)
MRLSDIVCFEATIPELQAMERDGVIQELVEALNDQQVLGKAEVKKAVRAIIQRENEASTGIGKGVAIPHIKLEGVARPVAVIGRSSQGLDFRSLDKQPVYTVILLISPKDNPDKHLQAMETIFRNLNNEDFRRFLRQAQSREEIREAVVDADVESRE